MALTYIEDNPHTLARRSKYLLLIGISENLDARSIQKLTDFAIGTGATHSEINEVTAEFATLLAHPTEAIQHISKFADKMLADVFSPTIASKDTSKLKSQHVLSIAIGTNKDRRANKTLTDLSIETGASIEAVSANNANFAMLLAHPVEAIKLIKEFSEKALAGEFSLQTDPDSSGVLLTVSK